MDLKTIVNQSIFGYEIRRNVSFTLLLHMLLFMDTKCGDVVSIENLGER
jgi:hypothetical protein